MMSYIWLYILGKIDSVLQISAGMQAYRSLRKELL